MSNKINSLLIPISIVLAGAVIGAAILYNPETIDLEPENIKNAGQFDFVELADELGLDKDEFKTCFKEQRYAEEVGKDYEAGVAAGVSATPTVFINGEKIEGAANFATFQTVIEEALAGKTPTVGPIVDDDAVLGDPNAPVTIIEFGDYQCPACGFLYENAEKQIISEYVDTGKVKIVYRDFPLVSIHPAAIPAAVAAECAGEQDAYWQYHDALFQRQAQL